MAPRYYSSFSFRPMRGPLGFQVFCFGFRGRDIPLGGSGERGAANRGALIEIE